MSTRDLDDFAPTFEYKQVHEAKALQNPRTASAGVQQHCQGAFGKKSAFAFPVLAVRSAVLVVAARSQPQTTAIGGCDLHLYFGKVPGLEAGDILGHEFMGIVKEVGSGVTKVKVGDRVVSPFFIACGTCFFCDRNFFSACETTNDSTGMALNKSLRPPAALFGFTKACGRMPGGQAEYVRVPMANTGPFKIPDALTDAQVLFLSDGCWGSKPSSWSIITTASFTAS